MSDYLKEEQNLEDVYTNIVSSTKKLKLKGKDIVNENIEKIGNLFPNCVTETEEGFKIDYDMLKQELSKDIVEGNKERYQLTWPGKKEAILNANTPCNKTLRAVREKSIDFDNTKNIYIEGDNLEVLKILQESYLNKIKCIYIDPPYNTGNDFIYNDNYNKTLDEELKDSGEIDSNGNLLVSNSSNFGKYHSNWLNMIYSRLKIARNLLSRDGIIFISIDDNELFNLKKICDEIFGERNFINCISIKMSELSGVKMRTLTKYPKLKESLLIYSKNSDFANLIIEKHKKTENDLANYLKYYSNIIEDKSIEPEKWKILSLKEYFKLNNIEINDNDINKWKIENADRMIYRTNSRTITKYLEKNPNAPQVCKLINEDGNEIIKWDDKEMLFLDKYIEEYLGDIWMDISTINLNKETDVTIYENGQKPLMLIKRIIKSVYNNKDMIVMDFFSGSATTAHAVMQLNAEDGLDRKYIMIQVADKISKKHDAYKKGYKSLCDIGEERIRQAGKKIKKETNANIDYGFRVYKVDSSNMKDVYYTPTDLQQSQLNMFESNIKEDRTAEDLLTQVILDLGLTLDLSIEERKIKNNHVYFVENNALVACFDDTIDINIIDEICKCNPLKIVCKESSFKTDSDKINIFERIRKLSNDTEINII